MEQPKKLHERPKGDASNDDRYHLAISSNTDKKRPINYYDQAIDNHTNKRAKASHEQQKHDAPGSNADSLETRFQGEVDRVEAKDNSIKKLDRLLELSEKYPDLYDKLLDEFTAKFQKEAAARETEETANENDSSKPTLFLEATPESELKKSLSNYAGNFDLGTPGFAFLKPEFAFFLHDLRFPLPPIPSKPLRPEPSTEIISSEIVGIVKDGHPPIICGTKLLLRAAGRPVQLRVKTSSKGRQYYFVLATFKVKIDPLSVQLISGWNECNLIYFANKLYESHQSTMRYRQDHYRTRYITWLKELREWEWELFNLARKRISQVHWSPRYNKDKIMAATKRGALYDIDSNSDARADSFYINVDRDKTWALNPRFENME